MTADALFPADAPTLVIHGVPETWVLRSCARCHAVVRQSDAREHTRWHQAVDTATTTRLPSKDNR